MSADAYLVVCCVAADEAETDGRCGAERGWPVRFEPHNHRELRRLLKTCGWRRTRGGHDLCPEHAGSRK